MSTVLFYIQQAIGSVRRVNLHSVHKGLEERVVQVRDDGAEGVDVS